MKSTFINAQEVKEILGVADAKVYNIIRELNTELKEKGYMVVAGRVSRQYFNERFYGLTTEESEE